MLYALEILARASVHTDHFALADEERHVDHRARFDFCRFCSRVCSISPDSGDCFDNLKFDIVRKFGSDRIGSVEHDFDRNALFQEPRTRSQHFFVDGNLFIRFLVHEVITLTVVEEVLIVFMFHPTISTSSPERNLFSTTLPLRTLRILA